MPSLSRHHPFSPPPLTFLPLSPLVKCCYFDAVAPGPITCGHDRGLKHGFQVLKRPTTMTPIKKKTQAYSTCRKFGLVVIYRKKNLDVWKAFLRSRLPRGYLSTSVHNAPLAHYGPSSGACYPSFIMSLVSQYIIHHVSLLNTVVEFVSRRNG